jgi:hypothetical protein
MFYANLNTKNNKWCITKNRIVSDTFVAIMVDEFDELTLCIKDDQSEVVATHCMIFHKLLKVARNQADLSGILNKHMNTTKFCTSLDKLI